MHRALLLWLSLSPSLPPSPPPPPPPYLSLSLSFFRALFILHLRLFPSPRLPACRFPLALALWALAPLLAMTTLALFHASEPLRSVERTRHESHGQHRGAFFVRPERAAADAGPHTTAEHAVVALYPPLPSLHQPKELLRSSRDGASNEARASPRLRFSIRVTASMLTDDYWFLFSKRQMANS
jgi:hypothetical protein